MACSKVLGGIAQDCDNSMGGIKKVWIASVDSVTAAYTTDAESGARKEVSGLTCTSGGSTVELANAFHYYYFKKGTASMTSTLNVDVTNGVNYVSTELQMTFSKMEANKRIEIAALALADMFVVVEDSNGNYWYLGADEAVIATAGTGQTGTAKTDGNNYQITLTDESTTFPYPLDSTLAATFEEIAD